MTLNLIVSTLFPICTYVLIGLATSRLDLSKLARSLFYLAALLESVLLAIAIYSAAGVFDSGLGGVWSVVDPLAKVTALSAAAVLFSSARKPG